MHKITLNMQVYVGSIFCIYIYAKYAPGTLLTSGLKEGLRLDRLELGARTHDPAGSLSLGRSDQGNIATKFLSLPRSLPLSLLSAPVDRPSHSAGGNRQAAAAAVIYLA